MPDVALDERGITRLRIAEAAAAGLDDAHALARRDNSTKLAARFKPLAEALVANEDKINAELIAAQGKPVDTGGYYLPDQKKTSAGMRPSNTLNAALAAF